MKNSIQKTAQWVLFGTIASLALVLAVTGFLSYQENTSMKASDSLDYPRTVNTTSPQERLDKRILEMYEAHDCWNSEAPPKYKGLYPGHVIVTYDGASGPTYGGQKMVDRALRQVFDGADSNFTVNAFCV